MASASWAGSTPRRRAAARALETMVGLPNMPIMVGTEKSSRVTAKVAQWMRWSDRAARRPRRAAVVIPPAHSEMVLTWSVPAICGGGPQRLLDTGHVGVEVPVPVLDGGVAPADHVHLEALGRGVLDQAAARGHVHEVVLVDLGRDQHHRRWSWTCSVDGEYWSSSQTSLRKTTAPGVMPDVPTDHVGVGVGGAGHAPVVDARPGRNWPAPATTLRPPVS